MAKVRSLVEYYCEVEYMNFTTIMKLMYLLASTCQAGDWICTQVPCGARCSAVGDPHYTTFDGLRYDFMGTCTYTLLQTENVTVDVENVACSGAITEVGNCLRVCRVFFYHETSHTAI